MNTIDFGKKYIYKINKTKKKSKEYKLITYISPSQKKKRKTP